MPLTLTIKPARGGGARQTRTLAEGTLSIGRAAGNDWVLADPDHHLSRTHCMIAFERGHYWLTDCSTNGMLINGAREPTTRESRVVLTDGDSVQLGGYLLQVAEVEGVRSGANSFAPSGGIEGGSPLDGDPLDDPFAQPPPTGFHHPIAHAPSSLGVEDPFDVVEKQFSQTDGDDDLFAGRTPRDAWSGPAQPDNADAMSHAVAAPRAFTPAHFDDIDFDALIGEFALPGAAPAPVAPAARVAPVAPVASVAPVAPVALPAPAQTAPPPAALLAAFLEGAGLSPRDLPDADQEAALRAIGALFRAFVGGTREVLMSRAQIKHEMRVEQTMIRSRDNNALKFAVSAEEAMVALLRPARPGYKPPQEAVEEAFRDILSHEMAVMAGMQTGLIALLKRFDPAGLEGRLQRGVLDNILPGARRARFWELFCTSYKEIAREAEDDFNAVFGRDFARAYDAQVNKL